MKPRLRLTENEKQIALTMLQEGYSSSDIGRRLGRPHQTISWQFTEGDLREAYKIIVAERTLREALPHLSPEKRKNAEYTLYDLSTEPRKLYG